MTPVTAIPKGLPAVYAEASLLSLNESESFAAKNDTSTAARLFVSREPAVLSVTCKESEEGSLETADRDQPEGRQPAARSLNKPPP